MKCQKCGINDVDFHYSSNINGCVTESHLCSECAASSGIDIKRLLRAGGLLDVTGILDGFFSSTQPSKGNTVRNGIIKSIPSAVDIEMVKRREINMLREQMQDAAMNDDFEKAIELREMIKRME